MTTRDSFETCTTAKDAIELLRGTDVKQVRIGIFDMDAIFREKTVSREKAEKFLADGFSFSDVLYKWDIGEVTYRGGAFADESAEIDPSSGRLYPFAPDTAMFVADFTGPHAAISPRNLVKAQIQRAADMGYGVRSGFEYEFFVFDESPKSLREKDYRNLQPAAVGNRTYSSITHAVEEGFIAGMMEALQTAGIELDSFHTELGPGCFEAPLLAREGLHAPDDAALFKTLTKAYAMRADRMATFMAKWSNDWPGQSGHLHLSLYKLDTGEQVFADPGNVDQPNNAMCQFIGGLIAYLPETLAMSAHTVNAYRRLVPGSWAPTHASWGVENRSCAVRAILEPSQSARIEFRVPPADSNPYLALAACLGCGLSGIEENIDVPPASEEDAYLETVDRGRAFPRSLLEAADRFRASAKARSLFGDKFVDWFAETREWEDRVFRAHVSDFDRRRYFEVV
jgi:glutamine synthetase